MSFPGIVLLVKRGGAVIYNNATYDFLGSGRHPLTALCGKVFADARPETAELELQGTTGASHRYLCHVSPVTSADGTVEQVVAVCTDISRQKAEIQRQERTRALLVDALSVAHLGIWDWTLGETTLDWTDELYRIYGVTPEQYVPTYGGYLSKLHPEDRERIAQEMGKVFHDHLPFSHDERIVRPDGEVRHLHTWGHTVFDEAGRPSRLIGVCQDVTELHQKQEDLKHSLSLLQATLESTTDGIVVANLNDRITVYNRAFLELWRLSEPELIERGYDWALQSILDQSLAPEDCLRRLREIRDNPELESHDLLELKDGRVYERNSRPQRAEGRIIGRVFSYRDITQRVRAERSLRDLAERSRTLAECSHKLAGARLDPGATLAQAALTMSRLVGDACVIRLLSPDQTRLEPVAYHHCDLQAGELLGSLLRGTFTRPGEGHIGRVALEGRTAFVPKAGLEFARATLLRQYWPYLDKYSIHSWIFVPMRAGDKVLGVASIFRDVTPDSYKPEDLSFAEELVSRIALAVENAELYEQARKAVQLREEFLAVASHELKTPLTPLRLELQLLSQMFASRLERGSPLENRLKNLLTDSDQQISRLIRLVEDMLDATRLETGRLTLNFEAVDLNRLVARVVEQLGSSQPRTAARLDFHPSPIPLGHWDRIRIEQVVTNLLTNAIKFGEEKPVEIRVAPDANKVTLTVRDHGIGIPPKDQTKIFDRLERAVSSREYGGLGMGLYIARQIVEAHGGHISVESTAGGGATFKVELPQGRAAA